MRLLNACMETCTRLVRTETGDGSGGFKLTWSDGAQFLGAIALSKSSEGHSAERETAAREYNVLTDRGTALQFHEVFRRESDGAIFRVTGYSSDKKTPAPAALTLECTTAERWELTQ